MMFTFLKAMGHHIGSSMIENDRIDTALQLLHHSEFAGKLHLPTDTIVASNFSNDADTRIVDCTDIPDNWMGLDIGPKTIEEFSALLKKAGTVLWNGQWEFLKCQNSNMGHNPLLKHWLQLPL